MHLDGQPKGCRRSVTVGRDGDLGNRLCSCGYAIKLRLLKVSLFITCLSDTFYPRSGIAVVKVLEYLGCQVDFPLGQTCCGQPLYNNGFHEDARELAKRMVGIFEHSDHVVTPSGSCAAMVRDYYADLLSDEPAYTVAAHALVDKTSEFVEFLVKVLKVDLRQLGVRWPGHATWHFSCHQRGLGLGVHQNDTERLLRQVVGLRYTRLEKIEQCCGFGGTFAMKYPQISGAIVREKVHGIKQTGATTVVSNDAGCTMNIGGACRRHGADVDFIHIAELIAEGLGLMEKGKT